MQLSEINLYPLKSAAGNPMTAASVESRGLVDDRRWMLVDEQGQFVTQRKLPRMALLRVQLTEQGLQLQAPGMPEILAPRGGGESLAVTVWQDEVIADHCGSELDRWCSEFLNGHYQLVYMAEHCQRQVSLDYGQPGDLVSFADGYPLLLISQASLDFLNTRLPQPVSMARFRPNLVVAGSDAHAEDQWRRIRIGSVEFDVAKPCARCVLTSVDPETGQVSPGYPLKYLAEYRRQGSAIYFGQNLIPRQLGASGRGCLQLGDGVEVLR